MLSKPKLTILSIMIVAMLLAVPMINAFDDVFTDYSLDDPIWTEDYSLTDPVFSNGVESDESAFSDDSYNYDLASDSEDLYLGATEQDYEEYDREGLDIDDTDADVNDNNYDSTSADSNADNTAADEDDFLWDNPFEDPINFDDPFDVPGDDIQDIGDDDIPATTPASNPEPTPGPAPGPADEEDGLSIQITGTRMQDEIRPGDQLLLKIYVKNNGHEDLDNMKIVLVNQELALRDSMGPMHLANGERASKTLLLDFPQGIEPGYYYLRINVHADGIDRVIYRDVRVE